ncbi:MAG: hypothetical protein KDB58_00155 [Solirubrobacterales bacterium]|nr:hypothetical protein [Solirubrobacterales bacterium]MCO5327273.1 hypothetical protein [Solirubrobacterales bacterium]
MRMALVTCERPMERDEDADFLVPALKRKGVTVEKPAWSDPRVDWAGYDLVKLSTPWDYHERVEDFRAWLRRADAAARLQNDLAIVEWNLDKRYLRELDAGGVETIPTVWSEPGAEGSAEEELARLGWPMVVIKPVVDLGAMNLVRVPAALAGQMLERFDRPVMAQPYLESIETSGELSLVFVEGELMHSLRKVPARGDFRIQPLYGGTHQAHEPTAAEVAAAERAVALAPGDPLYARVDIVTGEGGRPLVIELELIEPSLYLDIAPATAVTLADAMLARASRR